MSESQISTTCVCAFNSADNLYFLLFFGHHCIYCLLANFSRFTPILLCQLIKPLFIRVLQLTMLSNSAQVLPRIHEFCILPIWTPRHGPKLSISRDAHVIARWGTFFGPPGTFVLLLAPPPIN